MASKQHHGRRSQDRLGFIRNAKSFLTGIKQLMRGIRDKVPDSQGNRMMLNAGSGWIVYFNTIGPFRRIATRFDKLARNFLAAVALASTRLWRRAYESTTWCPSNPKSAREQAAN